MGEDGWTPNINGMINCGEHMVMDDLGFLHKRDSDEVSDTQRKGRAGRVTDSLVLNLKDPVAPSTKLDLPYDLKLQVCLAAMSVSYFGDIPGVSAVQKSHIEADLVTCVIVYIDISLFVFRNPGVGRGMGEGKRGGEGGGWVVVRDFAWWDGGEIGQVRVRGGGLYLRA